MNHKNQTDKTTSMPEEVDENIENEFSSQSLLSSFLRDSLKRMEEDNLF